MKIYKLKTEKGTYYDVVSDNGIDAICTDKNGRKWKEFDSRWAHFRPVNSIQIQVTDLPKSLQSDLQNFNIQ